MQQFIDKITSKSFNPLVFAFLCLYSVAVMALAGFSYSLQSSACGSFKCDVGKKMASKKDIINAVCLDRYEQQYSPFVSVNLFITGTFACVVVACVSYALFVKSLVEEVEGSWHFNPNKPRPSRVIKTCRVSKCYFFHLFVRLIVVILSPVLQHQVFFPGQFPLRFSCVGPLVPQCVSTTFSTSITSRYTSVVCYNLVSSRMVHLTRVFTLINAFLAAVTVVEFVYILFKQHQSRHLKRDFLSDSEFCRFYLLWESNSSSNIHEYQKALLEKTANETETAPPLIVSNVAEDVKKRLVDEVFVPLIIRTGRAEEELNFEDRSKTEYQKFPDEAIVIENLEDLFVANKDTKGKDPRTILVVGRPGIGKTFLCSKILHDWSRKFIGKAFEFVFLFPFRRFNSEENKKKSLIELLQDQMSPSSDVLQHMLDHPEKILLIFDGLDELKTDAGNIVKCGSDYADQMPVSALFEKLVKGDLLKGATVLTTTRATGVGSIRELRFDRRAEIVGFSPEKVEEYVKRFCNEEGATSERMWNHIKDSIDLLNLCYVPANSSIVCFVLQNCVQLGISDSLPTTVTQLYEYAIRIFLLKHHPEYQTQNGNIKIDSINSDEDLADIVKETLNRLQQVAFKGMEEKRQIFNLKEIEGMENCGLLHKIPGQSNKSQFYFLHFTMQEFLAARAVVHSKQEGSFICSKARDKSWYLVTQFVAGLLKAFPDRQKVFFDSYYETYSYKGKLSLDAVPVLMIKCFYEAGNDDIVNGIIDKLGDKSFFELDSYCTPSDCTACFYFFEKIKPFVRLQLFSSNFPITTFSELGRLLKRASFPILEFISSIEDEDLRAISDSVLENPCSRRDQGNTQQHIANSCEASNLNTLTIFINRITAIGVTYLCNILTSNYFKVRELNIGFFNSMVDDVVEALATSALTRPNCKLTKLNIRSNHIADVGAGALAEALKNQNCKLTELDISGNTISDVGAGALAEALEHHNCKLIKLDISCNKISHEGAAALANALTHQNCELTELDIGANNIFDVGACALANALTYPNCKLTKLDTGFNRISVVGAGTLAKALTHPNCKLTELNINGYHTSDVGADALAKALTIQNCKLIGLVIGNDISDKGADALANALTHSNCKLTELDISGKDISDVGAGALANALKHENCKLTKLNIRVNHNSDEGARALANALTHPNCKLIELHISHSNIFGVGARALAIALTHQNCKLMELHVSWKNFSLMEAFAIENILRHTNCRMYFR